MTEEAWWSNFNSTGQEVGWRRTWQLVNLKSEEERSNYSKS